MLQTNQFIKLKYHRYRLIKKIGAGGQSLVWRVERQSDKRAFALKTVNIYAQQNQSDAYHKRTVVEHLVERAWEEIEFFKQLGADADQHAIVVFRDQGIWEIDYYPKLPLPVVIMDLYDYDLSKYQAISHNPDQPYAFSLADLLRWAQQISDALCFIHRNHSAEQPYVHRDLKPANIVVNSKGDAALTDFGIVRAMANIGTSSVVASYHYCAPEQRLALYRNEERRLQYLITPALDVYSLAITLHELLAGSTQAQDKLSLQHVVEEHVYDLPRAGTINQEKVGLLGELGGLSRSEQQYLQQCVQRLFTQYLPNPPPKGETVAFAAGIDLPDQVLLSQQFAGLLTDMLRPWAADRPTAEAVKQRLHVIQQISQPTLTHFALAVQALADDTHCELSLTLAGEGLPSHLQWLQLYINGIAQPLPEPQSPVQPQEGIVLATPQTLVFHIPLPKETQHYAFRVFAKLAQTPYEAAATYRIQSSAEKLWATHDYFAALQQEIRAEWLQHYQSELLKTGKTFSNLKKLDQAYQQLQQAHPNNPTLQTAIHRLEALSLTSFNSAEASNEPDKQPRQNTAQHQKRRFKKLNLAMLVGLVSIISLGGVWFAQERSFNPSLLSSNNEQATIEETKEPTKIDEQSVGQADEAVEAVTNALWLIDASETRRAGLTQLEQLAADYPAAQFALGLLYDKGLNVKKDHKQAAEWYRKAAEQGRAIAQINLGAMYKNGKGVEQSDEQAVNWFRKAAEQDHARAQNNLGFMYEEGKGVEQSDREAVNWYHKAAVQGEKYAQYNLGWMYEYGKGGLKIDYPKALEWYKKAKANGHPTIDEDITRILKK